jgi:glucose-6-phosphate isomerase
MALKLEYYPKLNIKILEESKKEINAIKTKWDKPFFIDTKSYLNLENIKKTTNEFLNEWVKNLIVLGTGGSIQTLLAIKHLAHKKIFPITSSRAVELNKCLEKTKPEDSVVIPISRGGDTLDINSTIGIFIEKGYKFIGLSSKGVMYDILKQINCPILEVPDLSGRFAGSISNVGIVPAYLSEININDFIKGLDEGYKTYMNYDINPALELSTFIFQLYRKGYKVIFSMPYSKNLEGCVGLFVQELSESTGKNNKGIMGAYQSAPLCQHSILEFLLGGTKGIVIPILWTIENDISDMILNSPIDYINQQTAQTIINYQADATFQALIEQSIPSVKLTLEKPDEFGIGHLISFIQSVIYYLCLLINVNWADNPKVAIGKKICNDALKAKINTLGRKKVRENIAKEKFKDFPIS